MPRRLPKKDTEKPPDRPPPPPLVQMQPKTAGIRAKEPKLTLRLRFKQDTPNKQATTGVQTGGSPPSARLEEDSRKGAKTSEIKHEKRQPKTKVGLLTQTKNENTPTTSTFSSRTLEQDSTTQVLPSALRSPTGSCRPQREDSASVRPRVSFEAGTRESSATPKGRPCCVHPKLFKNSVKCTDALCRVDEGVTIEEVERLLGIKIDEFINDEEYERMRSRLENLPCPGVKSPMKTKNPPVKGEFSSTTSNDDVACEPALKGPSSGPQSPNGEKPSSGRWSRDSGRQSARSPNGRHDDHKVRFGPDVANHQSANADGGSVQRCVHPRRLSRDRTMDQNMSVGEIESLLGIKLDDVVPGPANNAKMPNSRDSQKQ